MLSFNGGLKVYVALEPCDMRKSFHGLTAMVRNHLGLDPLSGAAFLFTNKGRTLIKILYFDSTGVSAPPGTGSQRICRGGRFGHL